MCNILRVLTRQRQNTGSRALPVRQDRPTGSARLLLRDNKGPESFWASIPLQKHYMTGPGTVPCFETRSGWLTLWSRGTSTPGRQDVPLAGAGASKSL